MTDHAIEHVVVQAPLDRCFAALIDFEHYPAWAADIKETVVVTRDEQGRGLEVTWRAAAMGRSTTVQLEYDYSEAPERLSWHLTDGDIIRRYDGHYALSPAEGDVDATEIEYELSVDLVVPLPGFVKRRAEARIIKAALPDLKAYIEAGQASTSS